MNTDETRRLLDERCLEIAATGWKDYLPSSDGEDPEEEPVDIIHMVNQAGQYRGSILVVAAGGPKIETNTRDAAVYGSWGSVETKVYLSSAGSHWLATYWETVYQDAND